MEKEDREVEIGLDVSKDIIDIMRDVEYKKSIMDYANLLDQFDGDFINRMSDETYLSTSVERIGNGVESRDRLLQRIEKGIRRKRYLLFCKVTAALLTITLAVWYLSDKPVTEPQIAVAVSPEQEMPMLILGDGTKVILDKQVESTTLNAKLSENSLSYSNTGTLLNDSVELNTIVIPHKFTYTVILADGSEVVLNAGSKLTYPTRFTGDCRAVTLEGEAYFKVKKENKPFVVTSNGVAIKVLGTEFNVNRCMSELLEVVLVRGSVEVNNNLLKPNEKYTINLKSGVQEKNSVEVENYLGWLSNSFSYTDVCLDVLLEKVALWYGVEFIVDFESIKKVKLDLCVDKSSPIEELIALLERVTHIKFNVESEKKYKLTMNR